MKNDMTDQEKLMHEICMFDFICLDMGLYLDTHPKDEEALQYYTYYNRLYKQAKREYAVKYGALCMDDIDIPGACAKWNWSTQFSFQ